MSTWIVGIDEAGRGPIAGPVAVGGVCIEKSKYARVKQLCKEIRGKDSKKLTERKREEWFENIRQMQRDGLLTYAVSMSAAKMIDAKGIVPAIRSAMQRVLKRIAPNPLESTIKLDGALHAPHRYANQETIIKGDEKELVISLASICAKVERDRKMVRLAKKYPEYGFERHKGYGTKMHYMALAKHGAREEHRRSFLASQ
jgi:ribonuclease HII